MDETMSATPEDSETATMLQIHSMLMAFSSPARGRMLRYIAERLADLPYGAHGQVTQQQTGYPQSQRDIQEKMQAAQAMQQAQQTAWQNGHAS